MLYTTTQNSKLTFSHNHVLSQSRAEDGSLFVPLRNPAFTPAQIAALESKTFGQCVADVLNLLFQTDLTAWDVDFAIGRYPVRLVNLRNRMTIAECWHNPDWCFHSTIENLEKVLHSQADLPGNWVTIAARAAVLFGIFSELKKNGISQADISLVSGDCSAPVSAWYARAWGLPIGNIICCCNENQGLWDLLFDGQMRTDAVTVPSPIPEADITRPINLERLIFACGGPTEAVRYAEALRSGGTYAAEEGTLSKLRDGQYVSVVSTPRLTPIISGTYATHHYIHSVASALAYAGLLDYRAKTGQNRPAVIFAEKSPVLDSDFVANALGITAKELESYL